VIGVDGIARSLLPAVLGGAGVRDVVEARLEAVVAEPADVLHDGERELGSAAPDAVGNELGLEAVDEAFGERCRVTTVSVASDGAPQSGGNDRDAARPPRCIVWPETRALFTEHGWGVHRFDAYDSASKGGSCWG
jgi:hypothetical protein